MKINETDNSCHSRGKKLMSFTLIELMVNTSHLCCNGMNGIQRKNRPACRQVKL